VGFQVEVEVEVSQEMEPWVGLALADIHIQMVQREDLANRRILHIMAGSEAGVALVKHLETLEVAAVDTLEGMSETFHYHRREVRPISSEQRRSYQIQLHQIPKQMGTLLMKTLETFAVVRNPWDRVVSLWAFWNKTRKTDIPFDTFVRNLKDYKFKLFLRLGEGVLRLFDVGETDLRGDAERFLRKADIVDTDLLNIP
jgi:hypothetical protein